METNTAFTQAGMKLAYTRPETELVLTATKCMDFPGGLISDSTYDGDGAAKEVVLKYSDEAEENTTPEVLPHYSVWED